MTATSYHRLQFGVVLRGSAAATRVFTRMRRIRWILDFSSVCPDRYPARTGCYQAASRTTLRLAALPHSPLPWSFMYTGASRVAAHVPNRRFVRARLLWCNWFHDDLTWPSHGRYACRTCGIVFTVPWRHQNVEATAATSATEYIEPESLSIAPRARLEA